jgi:hypothetical protein
MTANLPLLPRNAGRLAAAMIRRRIRRCRKRRWQKDWRCIVPTGWLRTNIAAVILIEAAIKWATLSDFGMVLYVQRDRPSLGKVARHRNLHGKPEHVVGRYVLEATMLVANTSNIHLPKNKHNERRHSLLTNGALASNKASPTDLSKTCPPVTALQHTSSSLTPSEPGSSPSSLSAASPSATTGTGGSPGAGAGGPSGRTSRGSTKTTPDLAHLAAGLRAALTAPNPFAIFFAKVWATVTGAAAHVRRTSDAETSSLHVSRKDTTAADLSLTSLSIGARDQKTYSHEIPKSSLAK